MTASLPQLSLALCALALLSALLGCSPSTPPLDAVRARAIDPLDAILVSRGEGRLYALRQHTVTPEENGQVQWRLAVGERANAGEVVARLRPGEDNEARTAQFQVETALASARTQIPVAQSALANARRTLQQTGPQRLTEVQARLDQAHVAARAQQAALERAESALREAGEALARTLVRAPFAGVVSQTYLAEGEMAQAGRPLLTLAEASSLRVRGLMSAGPLQIGQPCVLRTANQPKAALGVLISLTPQAGQAHITAEIQPPDTLAWPLDVAVDVLCLSREPRADELTPRLLLPRQAVQTSHGRAHVWQVVEGRARRQAVRLGAAQGDWVEAHGAVQVGDLVLLSPPAELSEDAQVRLR